MQEQAEVRGEPGGVRDAAGGGARTPADEGAVRVIGTRGDIPIRRYGSAPLLDDEPVWEQVDQDRPRTIAESGGGVVLLVALATAAIVGLLLYLN
jgi:hypothetical protein